MAVFGKMDPYCEIQSCGQVKYTTAKREEAHTEPDFTGEMCFYKVRRRDANQLVQIVVMHNGDEVGTAEYDYRKLFSKKKLKYSTWLDLKYEGQLIGKLGLCMWLQVDDFLEDIKKDIMRRVKEEVIRIYMIEKCEVKLND